MGQEASLPTDGRDGSLEEQAKAPPSATNPPSDGSSSPSKGKSNRKNFIFRHHNAAAAAANNDSPFEQRESARATAAAGNIYQRENSDDDFTLQKMPATPEAVGATFFQPQQRAAAAMQEAAEHQHQLQQLHEMNSSNKSSKAGGLFQGSRPSARGMIHSMRNLSIGGALRKQKEINDWEKQWDEDEDEDSDEEEEEEQVAAAPRTMTPPPPPPPPQQQAVSPARTMYSGVAAPVSPQPPAAVVTEDYARSSASNQQAMDWEMQHPPPQQQLVEQQQGGRKPDVKMFLPMLRVLGKGSFGKVVLVQKREGKERGQLFAMKILKKTHLVKRRQIERTRTERKVLSVVSHPFIMRLHYAFQTPEKLYLVLDYCPGGELFFHLSRFRRFPERVARFYAAELLLAIGHLHKRGIIYRDLKPENVLLDAEGHVKLGDFGLAKAGISHPYEGANSMCGTPEYMSPEILGQMGHGFCVDYWGLGMLVYEMMTGLPPWYTTDRNQLFRRLKSAPLDIPSYFSPAAANCVASLLERNPRRRLGVTGIRAAMEHEYFRSISWRSLYSRKVEAPVRPCEGWKPPAPVREGGPHIRAQSSPDARPVYPDGVAKLDSNELDTATQNFDNQFLRMPVESEDHVSHESSSEENELMEDLNEDTFLGFTFDVVKNKEDAAAAQQQGAAPRYRTQNYHAANGRPANHAE